MQIAPELVPVESDPPCVEVGHDAVEIDAQSHPVTLGGTRRRARRSTARGARTVAALALAALPLVACGGDGDASPEPTRSYTLHLRADDSQEEYSFIATDPVDLRVGDEVTFELDNTGSLAHDIQVVHPDGDAIGVAAAAEPGATTSVTVLFEEPGYYRLNCLVDDHLTTHRMQAIVEVTDA